MGDDAERPNGPRVGGEDGRISYVHEKVWGKWLAEDKPSSKKKKTSSSSRREEGDVSIRSPAPHQRQKLVVLDLFDDDGVAMPPPSTPEMPPPPICAGIEMREMRRA